MVTHRLSVLERVDRVFFMKSGRVRAQGSFAELVATDQEFREFISSMQVAPESELEDSSAPKTVSQVSPEPAEHNLLVKDEEDPA